MPWFLWLIVGLLLVGAYLASCSAWFRLRKGNQECLGEIDLGRWKVDCGDSRGAVNDITGIPLGSLPSRVLCRACVYKERTARQALIWPLATLTLVWRWLRS